jgi:hypothetical protein
VVEYFERHKAKVSIIIFFIVDVAIGSIFVSALIYSFMFIAAIIAFGSFHIYFTITIAIFCLFAYVAISIVLGKNGHIGRSLGVLIAPFAMLMYSEYISTTKPDQRTTHYSDKDDIAASVGAIMSPKPPATLSSNNLATLSSHNKSFSLTERANARHWLETSASLSNSLEFNVAYIVLSKGGLARWREAMDIIWALPPNRHAVAMTSSG